jgi:hypothetical protein
VADGPFDPETGELISRPPERADLVELCRQLQDRGASFMVLGGFAVILSGYAPLRRRPDSTARGA